MNKKHPKQHVKKRHVKQKIIEIGQAKPRLEEKKFFLQFSGTQTNAILLLILSASFLMQGIIQYFEYTNKISYVRPWFNIVIISLIFLTSSVMLLSIGGVTAPLKVKRYFNLFSFIAFILGFGIFLYSLILLLIII